MDQGILESEAHILHPYFQTLKKEFSAHNLNEAQFVALYLLTYQLTRTPKNALQGVQKKLQQKKNGTSLKVFLQQKNLSDLTEYFLKTESTEFLNLSLEEIFELNFKGLPKKMNMALTHWLQGNWPLKLFFHIPNAREILEMQKQGSRCVTVLTSKKSLATHILGKRDTLSFVIHDLEHAVNFYQEEHLKDGQIGFYHFVDSLLKETWMQELLASNNNEELHHHLDYVIADMNAYSVHLTRYLYGILKRFHASSEELEKNWKIFLQNLNAPEEITHTLMEINSPTMPDIKVENLHSWFVAHGFQSLPKDESYFAKAPSLT